MADLTLIELLRQRATDEPDRRAFTFLRDGERDEEDVTYAELDAAARVLGAELSERARPGDRALLVYAPGFDYIRAIFGCLYAGIVAVPLYPPGLNRLAPPLAKFADDCDATLILTTSEIEEAVRAQPGVEMRTTFPTDRPAAEAGAWKRPDVDDSALAFLQYTSGSTSFPKGVMLSHRNLLANFEMLAAATGQDSSSQGVSWLPPYHDMGLIGGILWPVYGGWPLTHMSPLHFLERPMRWLEAVTRFRATITGGPNFAYDLAVRRATDEEIERLDLSALEVVSNGAEPVRPATMDAFCERFAAAGIRREAFLVAYGMAESTLLITVSQPTRAVHVDARRLEEGHVEHRDPGAGGTRTLAAVGTALEGSEVAIVDPSTCERLPPGRAGEIWVASPSIAEGYWRRPEESERMLRARIEGEDGGRRWLRTGDIGFVDEGQIVWTGRLKDLIVVYGRNVHPEDVEMTVEASHGSLRPGCGVVFVLDDDDAESIAVVQELRKGSEAQADEAAEAIRRAVAREHQLPLKRVVLIEAGGAPKTSSGKKQRRGTRELLRAGELPVVHDAEPKPAAAAAAPRSSIDVARWLTDHIAGACGIEPDALDPNTPLLDFGLTSVQAADLAGELSRWLGRDISMALVFDHPTIERLAAHLGDDAGADDRRAMDRPAGRRRPRRAEDVQEPIAIVGMGCRLPGAGNPGALLEMLRAGGDGITEVPPDRWDADALFDPELRTPGKTRTRWGGFVDGIDQFDPQFFGITPREARWIDPQHRLVLEVAWEALEDGAIAPDRLRGEQGGVFIGIGGIDYQARLARRLKMIDPHGSVGNAHSVAANRLSFILDLRGPSLAVDTACSSASVAIHMACQSLDRGESDIAMAGGTNVIITPEATIAFSVARMLSPDGRCRTFDERANGYVRSEGCGILVLKRLSDALHDGDRIRAVIRGTAVNQDGQTNGLTAPSARAQAAVIRSALARAGAEPHELGYVEAHGTGTPLGDPIEVEGIAGAVGPARDDSHRVPMGSVKANIGHTETVAGVAGVIKTVLALENREIYPQPHFEQLNKRIELDGTPLEVPRELRAWEANGRTRLAGVNSFGFGGTNAHVVVEEAPAPLPARNRHERSRHVLTLSARSGDALAELAGRYSDALSGMPEETFPDACYTAQVGRTHQPHRAGIVASTPAEARERLDSLARGERAGAAGHVNAGVRPMIGFLFTGQGAQYAGMGRALREAEPVFRRALTECAELMDAYLDHDVLDLIDGGPGEALLDDTRYTQPVLFVLEWALAELWRSWGIEPDVVLGHSVGEYVAACVSGAVELEDGVALIAERARLMSELPAGGGMLSVLASEERMTDVLREVGGQVTIAAVNGPEAVTIAGPEEELGELAERLGRENVGTRRLKVSHAFHTELIEPMLDDFERVAERFEYREPRIPLITNITGRPLAPTQAPDARHWREHTRSPVRFADGIRSMLGLGVDVFLEVGPHPTLISPGKASAAGAGRAWLPSLRRDHDDLEIALGSLAGLYVNGVEPDWSAFHRRSHRRPVELPSYPFQRSRHWIDIDPEGEGAEDEMAAQGAAASGHPLLGRRLATAGVVLEGRLGLERHPYLGDHRVQGRAVLPATAFLEMALAAAGDESAERPRVLRDIVLRQPLMLGDDATRVQVSAAPLEGGERDVTVQSARGDGSGNGSVTWTIHARATAGDAGAEPRAVDLELLRARCADEVPAEDVYAALERRGLEYGPAFRGLRRAWRGEREVLGEIELPEGEGGDGYRAHPALLDACLHVLAAGQPGSEDGAGPMIPVAIDSVAIYGPLPRSVVVHARLAGLPDAVEAIADLAVFGPSGDRVADLRGLHLLALDRGQGGDGEDPASWLHDLAFSPQEAPDAAAAPGDWVVLADRGGVGPAMAELIRGAGGQATLVTRDEGLERALEPGETPGGIIHLWGLDAPEPGDDAWLDEAVAAGIESLTAVVQALVSAKRRARLVVVTRGAHAVGAHAPAPAQAMLFGFARSLSLEHPELRVTAVDVDPEADASTVAAELAGELTAGDEPVVALRAGVRHVGRLSRRAPARPAAASSNGGQPALVAPRAPAFRLRTRRAGVLDALELAPAERHPPESGQVQIEVRAAGLNFRDVMKVMGVYPGSAADRRSLGDECSGTVVAIGSNVEHVAVGDDVIAVAPWAFSSYVTTLAQFVVPKPDGLSHEQASALPIAFMTAIHGLRHVARLREGERCLVHAAAGGVGMAAIQVARAAGAEVLATAGSDEKRGLLRSLGVEHVMDSRSLSFADDVRELTGGEGVDVVLNSLGGEAIPRSLALLRPFGRFVEIGKRDIFQNSRVGLRPFRNAISFHAVDLDRLLRERHAYGAELLREAMAGFAEGTFEPPPVEVHPIEQVGRAFRAMAQARHVGKLSISFEDQTAERGEEAPTIRADGTYVVTGGFGDLGLAVARRLAERGAGVVALLGRRPPPKHVEDAVAAMEAAGARVRLDVADVTNAGELARALARLRSDGPEVRGVVHAAGSLDDAFVVNLTPERCRRVVAPKAAGAWALHRATEDLPLDFFVMFSSATAVLGSPGQAHYAAGNAFLNAFAEWRRHAGFPATSIGWGAWSEIGMAARASASTRSVVDQVGSIPPGRGLDLLERFIEDDEMRVEVLPFDWEKAGRVFAALARSPLTAELVSANGEGRDLDPAGAEVLAAPDEELDSALERFVRVELGRVAEISPADLDPTLRVNEIGLDSMMALELKNRVEGTLDVELPIVELIEGPSITELAVRLGELIRASRGETGGAPAIERAAPVAPP